MKAPSTLSADGRKLWGRILKSCEILEPELETLRLALESRDEMMDLRAKIQKTGPLIKNKVGDLRPNPLYRPLKEARQTFLRCWRNLNFKSEDDIGRRPGRPPDKNKFSLED